MTTDLSIQLGSLQLRSPIIVGSSPLTLDEIQRISLVSNGVGAMVLSSVAKEEEAAYCRRQNNNFTENRQPIQGRGDAMA